MKGFFYYVVTSFHAFLLKQIRNLWILRWDPKKNLTAEQFLIASMVIETEFLSLQAVSIWFDIPMGAHSLV